MEELTSSTNFLGFISLPDLLVGAVESVVDETSVLAFFGWLSSFSSESAIELSSSSAFLFVAFPLLDAALDLNVLNIHILDDKEVFEVAQTLSSR